MTEIYTKLAKHLDNLPASFPATESGVELRILENVFTEKEAEAAMALSMIPESAQAIAKRLGKDESDIEALFYSMSQKGLIFRLGRDKNLYMAANFITGIWEYNVNNLNEELVHDVDEYLPQIWEKTWSRQKTQQLRVIPVSKSISTQMNIMPYEQAETIIKEQSKILVAPCICRKEHTIAGHGCDKPVETCLMLGASAFFYEQNGIGRSISQQEALKTLNSGIEHGLVLQPSNSQNPSFICMCCGCCCFVLKNLNTFDEPAKIACTNFYALTDEDDCTGCETCTDICQMNAITMENTKANINLARCIGCGLCVAQCEFDAITLLEKEESTKCDTPADPMEQYMKMAQERGLL